jgi:hypothetical protein
MQAWRVLYTKQLQKKRKTYADGFVVARPSGAVLLLDEGGKELAAASAPLPPGEDWGACEGAAVFPGFLVNGDGACGPGEAPGSAGGGGGGEAGPSAERCSPAPPAACAGAPAAGQHAPAGALLLQHQRQAKAFRRPQLAASAAVGGGACPPGAQQQHAPPGCGGAGLLRPAQQAAGQPRQAQQQHAGRHEGPIGSQPCGGVRAGGLCGHAACGRGGAARRRGL